MSATRRALLAALPGLTLLRSVRAQDEPCPPGMVCLDYKDEATVQIDPSLGYLQSICVAEIVTTVTSFGGTTTTQQVRMADYVSNGDTYDLAGEVVIAREGPFKDASLGDVFVLREVTDAD